MTARAASRPGRGDRWLLVGWVAAISITLAGTIQDTDPYWQVRAGLENLDGAPLARPDSWSWAPVDGLFYPNSPAWNVVLALAWRAAGSWGLYLVTVASIAALLGLIAWLGRRLGAHPIVTVLVLLATSAGMLPILTARPALPAQVLVLLALGLGALWADRAGRVPLWQNLVVATTAGFALSLAGNWIHLSWSTFAVATAAGWAVTALLTRSLAWPARLALIVGGSVGLLGAVLLGPYGLDVVERSRVVLEVCRGLIVEWTSPFSPEFIARWGPEAVLVLGAVLALAVWLVRLGRARGWADPRLPLAAALVVVSLPYALAGLQLIRFVPVALGMIAPVLAAGLTAAFAAAERRAASIPVDAGHLRRRLPEWLSPAYWRVIWWILLALLAPFALFAGSNHAEPATVEVNELLPSGCNVFGTSIESASIILTRPDVHTWYDGRADYWGRVRLLQAHRYLYQLDEPTLVPPGTTCVVLAEVSTDAGLVGLTAALDADPAWQRVPGTTGASLWLPAAIHQ